MKTFPTGFVARRRTTYYRKSLSSDKYQRYLSNDTTFGLTSTVVTEIIEIEKVNSRGGIHRKPQYTPATGRPHTQSSLTRATPAANVSERDKCRTQTCFRASTRVEAARCSRFTDYRNDGTKTFEDSTTKSYTKITPVTSVRKQKSIVRPSTLLFHPLFSSPNNQQNARAMVT